MCGILGSVNIPIDKEDLNLISHRGPDSCGLELFSSGTNEVFLGHRRLSILDLSEAGHQPMISDCGDYCIIFNGEIYNHEELRTHLQNVKFRGHSDTETLLYYLKDRWVDGLCDLNGVFAFAFFDFKTNKALIARDPHGVKPLYYIQQRNSFLFSSEIRAIEKFSEKKVSKENLATLLTLRYNPSPYTLFEDVKKVRPGHNVLIDFSQSNISIVHSSYVKNSTDKYKGSFHSAVGDFSRELEAAVNRQLMSDVEVGVLLSGGVDSAVVAALAQKQLNYKMKAFTVGFEGQDKNNEIDDAARTAELLGLDHHYVKIGFDDFIGTLAKCNSIIEEPIATTSHIPMYFLSELASQHVKVVLSGQGADEPLGGYTRYQGEYLHHLLPKFLLKGGVSFLKLLAFKNESLNRGISSLAEHNDVTRFIKAYSIFSNEEILKLIGISENRAATLVDYLYNSIDCKNICNSVARMMKIDARANLSDDLLMYSDKITMNFSLENRVPLLDLDLVRFIESLPLKYRIKLGKRKIILKEAAKNIIPTEIINRPKKGFKSPTDIWFKTNIEEIKELLLSSKSEFSSFFSQKAVKVILDKHVAGYNKEKQIFLLLSLYFWFQKY